MTNNTNSMTHDYYNSDYTERDDLDWDVVLSPDEYIYYLDKCLYARSNRMYDCLFHKYAENCGKLRHFFHN